MGTGFTLIELSIVLVILGLIAGGILTGQDLIKTAEVRATISQIEKYNTAVNTFQNKYGGLPGDLLRNSASSFGLFSMTPNCGSGCGNGNGILDGWALIGSALISQETVVFFRHLSEAGLIDGFYAPTGAASGNIASDGTIAATTSGTGISLLLPAAKLGNGNYIAPVYATGTHYFIITGMGNASLTATTGVISGETNNLTAQQAYSIDKKVDDGLPGSGNVRGVDGTTQIFSANGNVYPYQFTLPTTTQTNCITVTNYNLNPGTTLACSLAMRFN